MSSTSGTKQARDLARGDSILVDGARAIVTDARSHRRYRGYMAIQADLGGHIKQLDMRANQEVDLAR